MSERKTNEQKLHELITKKEQLKAQIKSAEARIKQTEKNTFIREYSGTTERRERTHRLIQIGALSEKYFDCENIDPAEFENLLKRFVEVEQIGNIINGNKF